jgi:hypothetical protein
MYRTQGRPHEKKNSLVGFLNIKTATVIIWDVTPVLLYKITGALDHLLRNVSKFLPDYTQSHSITKYSS